MNEKLGPLKTWQWGILLGGALLVYYLYKKNKEGSETQELAPTETFATGTPVGQAVGSETGIGGSGSSQEQPAPAPAPTAAAPESQGIAPGLGAGQLYATELAEVLEGRNALLASGLIPPAQGNVSSAAGVTPQGSLGILKGGIRGLNGHVYPNTAHNRTHPHHLRTLAQEHGARQTAAKRKQPTHAKQGSHHHAQAHEPHRTSPHHGAHPASHSARHSGGTRAPSNGSAHKRRRR